MYKMPVKKRVTSVMAPSVAMSAPAMPHRLTHGKEI